MNRTNGTRMGCKTVKFCIVMQYTPIVMIIWRVSDFGRHFWAILFCSLCSLKLQSRGYWIRLFKNRYVFSFCFYSWVKRNLFRISFWIFHFVFAESFKTQTREENFLPYSTSVSFLTRSLVIAFCTFFFLLISCLR